MDSTLPEKVEKSSEFCVPFAQNVRTLLAKNVCSWAFNDMLVRTVAIDDNSWFVAKDVSAALEYRNATDLTRSLDSDEVITCSIPTSGGVQEMLVINEPGLYHAIFMSRKEAAKEFRRWVTNEVLPAIRKNGGYALSLDAELEQEKKRSEIAQLRANRYILEHIEEFTEKNLLTRSNIQGIINGTSSENSSAAFSDEDLRIKTFIFETCRIAEFAFVTAADLYARYENWANGKCLSRNTFVRRVQKVMGKFVDYKQKRVNGEVVLVFTGMKFLEEK